MKFRLLSKTEKELFGADAMAIVDYVDVAALGASTTGTLSVYPATTNGAMPAAGTTGTDTFAAGMAFRLTGYRLIDQFVSSTAAGLTLSVGDGGSATRFLAATQMQSGQTPVSYSCGVGTAMPFAFTAADTVDAFFTSTTANLSTFTAGKVILYFRADDLNRLPTS